ncbi:zinc knuckle CX2CX4HX4C containing protein [Tanacetum coccineum]
MQSWGRSSYARAMIELRADVELKDTIMVAMPKLIGEGFYMCTICVEYEWKPPTCSSCKVFGHVRDECPKNIVSDVVKNLKTPRQAARGVQVGPKLPPLHLTIPSRHLFGEHTSVAPFIPENTSNQNEGGAAAAVEMEGKGSDSEVDGGFCCCVLDVFLKDLQQNCSRPQQTNAPLAAKKQLTQKNRTKHISDCHTEKQCSRPISTFTAKHLKQILNSTTDNLSHGTYQKSETKQNHKKMQAHYKLTPVTPQSLTSTNNQLH